MSELETSSETTSQFDSKAFLETLSHKPGVYQMYDSEGTLLYVGKAKNLKNRVSSYFRSRGLNNKTVALVQNINSIEVTVTNSDTEALLLEQTLIKLHRPQYNILLKDDKSYPFILITTDQKHPAIKYVRGKRKRSGRTFGPYPSALAVKESLNTLQKIFQIRNCEDAYYRNRSRPCLQFQIKRCTAPCTGEISDHDYAEEVRHAIMFLEGKNIDVIKEVQLQMEAASEELNFEKAAYLRDQVNYLRKIQEKQYVHGESGDADVFAIDLRKGGCCVHALTIRAGRVLGTKSYYPKVQIEQDEDEVLTTFLAQMYLNGLQDIPTEVITNVNVTDGELIAEAIKEKLGQNVVFKSQTRGDRAKWLSLAEKNATQALDSYLSNKQTIGQRYVVLKDLLDLEDLPKRIECFDISHNFGEATVASCVVFDGQGPKKSDYRRFNIKDIQAGDDYAAMAQALTRRYSKVVAGEGEVPDIILIDGGKGQVHAVKKVLDEIGLSQPVLLGIAKGTTRKAGFETLWLDDGETPMDVNADSPALHLLQYIRDESHRFAITGHRQQASKARKSSTLENIEGVGPKRRKELLKFFGSLSEIKSASVEEIAKVPGVSKKLAEEIYHALH